MSEHPHILMLSYFAPPMDTVGVQRAAYWHQNLPEHGIKSTLFTAIEQETFTENTHYVPAKKSKSMLSYFIKDEGLHWVEPLKNKLKSYSRDSFSHILITGGPFMHMMLTGWLKKNFSATVILDFRDPFYANPRFQTSWLKDRIKKHFQTQFLNSTDKVITVNQACADLIDFDEIHIIDNGFNDKVVAQIEFDSAKRNTLKHPMAMGRIDNDIPLNNFFEVLEKENLQLHYAGNQAFPSKFSSQFHSYGKLSYQNLMAQMDQHQNCVLFTSGHPFESTTKIFDFLALNKNILILTQGKTKTGALHEITKNYPNIFWAENSVESIHAALQQMLKHKTVEVDVQAFSRKAGLKKLIKILRS